MLTAEQLLQEEGRLSEEWTDVWQLPWRRWGRASGHSGSPGGASCRGGPPVAHMLQRRPRAGSPCTSACRAVSACGDLREMLLYTAALQQHVQAAPDVLPRQVGGAPRPAR